MSEITLPYKIDLPLPELTRERNYRAKFNYIILGDNFFENSGRFRSEIENEETKVWEDGISFYRQKVKKEKIAAITFRYWKKNALFAIEIDVDGLADTIYLWFETKVEAENIFKIIDGWLYG